MFGYNNQVLTLISSLICRAKTPKIMNESTIRNYKFVYVFVLKVHSRKLLSFSCFFVVKGVSSKTRRILGFLV